MSDHAFVAIEYFIMNKEYNRFDWLLLSSFTGELDSFSEGKKKVDILIQDAS